MKYDRVDLSGSEVVFWCGKEWKKVVGYLNSYVTKDGCVGILTKDDTIINATIAKWSTTKGTYLYARLINEDKKLVFKAVHQLICQTFNGLPPNNGLKYEPNHIDGDKHNNCSSNLEWMTRSENVQHAFNQGLCIVGLRIDAINILTKETKKYNSLNSMSKEWGISRKRLTDIIANHRSTPYQGIWIFVMDDSSDKKLSRYQRQSIIYKDYVTGDVIIVNDSQEAAMNTKVKSGTIMYKVSLPTELSDKLLSRYVFKRLADDIVWPSYSIQEALESEKKYKESQKY